MITLGIIIIIFLIILILGHELGHFLAAKSFGVKVEEFGFGFPPRISSRQIGETRYSFNLLPFGGFVKLYGEHRDNRERLEDLSRSFTHQPISKRMLIIIAGVFANFLIGWLALSLVFYLGIPPRLVIEEVTPGSPAAMAGLKPGEQVGNYNSANEFLNFVKKNANQPITVNGKTLVPRANPPSGQGPLGIKVVEVSASKKSLVDSLESGFQVALKTVGLIFAALGKFFLGLVTGNFGVLNQVTGPVGIFGIIGETSKLGLTYLVQLLGIISLNLAVINLFPFPALDGGRLLFLLGERIAGHRFNHRVEMTVNALGIALLLLLMVIITFRDIMKIL